MSNYGIKISKPNYDVETAALIDQIFNSEHNCIKLSQKLGTVSSTLDYAETETFEIAHGFSFTPGFLAWFEVDGDGTWYFMYSRKRLTAGYSGAYCAPFSDATNLSIVITNDDITTHTIIVYYVIFADEGA